MNVLIIDFQNDENHLRCPQGILNRLAFAMLDATVTFWNVAPIEGKHYPNKDFKLEAIKRHGWAKLLGLKQYGYKGIHGFKNSGDFFSDDSKFPRKEDMEAKGKGLGARGKTSKRSTITPIEEPDIINFY